MSTDNKRWIAKLKNISTRNGTMQKIYIDNINEFNKDGTPNQYHKGLLIWADKETGKNFIVKQIGFSVPKDGMKKALADQGYSSFLVINLGDGYDVDPIE